MKKKAVWIIPAAFLIAVSFITFFVIRRNERKESVYRQAVQEVQAGNDLQAYHLFQKLGRYKDAEAQMSVLTERNPALPYQTAEKGDALFFDHWEQDGDESNGPEPIEWIVLDKIDGQLLLLSSACLMGKAYNTESFVPVTWETCSLRQWLNEDFLNGAFTEEEQAWIPSAINENPDHSMVETPGGQDTEDRVFLPCERDTVIYLKDDLDREAIGKALATQTAVDGGLQVNGEGMASWWLRSPGMYEYTAQFVDRDGTPYTNGASTDIDYLCGVRPAVWLDAKGAHS